MKSPCSSSFSLLLYLIVFLTPLLTPAFGLGYEQIKVAVFLFLVSLAILIRVWVVQKPIRQPAENTFPATFKAAVLFLLVLLVASFFAIDLKTSLFGIDPYSQGFILYLFMFIFAWLVLKSTVKPKTILIVLSVSAVIVAALAIKDFLIIKFTHFYVPTYAGKVVSTFGQPNFYAGFLVMILPLTYYLLIQIRGFLGKTALMFSLLINLLAILISQSRAALVIVVILILALLLSHLKFRLKTVMVSLTILVILASTLLSVYFGSGMIWKELGEIKVDQGRIHDPIEMTYFSAEKRIYIYPVMLNLIAERPFLGYGLENITQAYSDFFQKVDFNSNKNRLYYSLRDLVVNRAHSYFLDLLLFSGITGFLAWIFLYRQLLVSSRKGAWLVFLLVYLIWVSVQIQSVAHLMLFWLSAGLIARQA